eukprot:m.40617 g.40617  ORF g.40617 m.40617 type:complete len:74 (+) comp32986_c0_seq3:663-884(+)
MSVLICIALSFFLFSNAGISRSTAIVCAYIMKAKEMSFDEALDLVKSHRPSAKPNEGFAKQLREITTEKLQKM